jgi:hypothetical protein
MPVSLGWSIRSVDPVAVKLAGLDIRKVGMPDLMRFFIKFDLFFFNCSIGSVNQTLFIACGVVGE